MLWLYGYMWCVSASFKQLCAVLNSSIHPAKPTASFGLHLGWSLVMCSASLWQERASVCVLTLQCCHVTLATASKTLHSWRSVP